MCERARCGVCDVHMWTPEPDGPGPEPEIGPHQPHGDASRHATRVRDVNLKSHTDRAADTDARREATAGTHDTAYRGGANRTPPDTRPGDGSGLKVMVSVLRGLTRTSRWSVRCTTVLA